MKRRLMNRRRKVARSAPIEKNCVEVTYIRVRKGKVAKTKELLEDEVFADFDSKGRLIGVEIL